ncbi:MAG: DNA replication/repair protein RecF [Bacteroidales bacterium]|nr:DNA replication/repair protein RecF [Bacteroidales bacterium]
MFLQNLKISNFKNYISAEFDFAGKINCFIGNNGAGKTNILDAIYYLSFCKSYFNYVDMQNILHDAPFFAVHGTYIKNGNSGDLVSIIQKRNAKKVFKLNDKEYNRLSDHIGLFPLVMISPYDRDLINEGSEARRKYIDSVISQFDKIYLDDLINYNKALQQRNILLKQFSDKNYFDHNALEIWDSRLIKLGEKIHSKRKEFISDFIPLFQHYFNFISNGKEQVSINYESQLNDRKLEELLAITVDKDRQIKYTSCGIHKDDLIFKIDGHPVKKFGSQGQQKSYVIAVKLAQFDYTRDIKNFKPILLLDDIFDKLDEERVKQIIHLVADNSLGQTFITDTQHDRIKNIFQQVDIEHKIFLISDGNVTEIN